MKKLEAFVKQCLGAKHQYQSFSSLSISTATIDVRLPENTNLDYKGLFEELPVVSHEEMEKNPHFHWAPGTITGAKEGIRMRGMPPTSSEKALKNSAMIWIWLKEKWVNMKISRNSLHVTGCKKLEHASEAVRYLQQHIQLIELKGRRFYEIFPFAMQFDNHMINYNFNLGVALSLPDFDQFVSKKYHDKVFSPYDQNIHHTTMPLTYHSLRIKYTINDNGQISMCVSSTNVEIAVRDAEKGYRFFFEMLDDYYNSTKSL